ncbi:MAG: metal-dependent transcriptional regulator [Armatimonadota bacterium]
MPDLINASLSANMQDYLEAILELETARQVARVRDIAARLKVHVSSVSNALRVLKTRELVEHESYGYVTLTPLGRNLAQQVQQRHEAIVDFLERILGMPGEQAEAEACRLEHSLGQDGLQRLKALNEFMRAHPGVEEDWRGHLHEQFAEEDICIPDELAEQGPAGSAETTLDLVPPGTTVQITRVCGTGSIRRRLLDMGLRPGAEIMVERLAPLGDPIEVRVMDYHLSLRKSEAASLRVVVTAAPVQKKRKRGSDE